MPPETVLRNRLLDPRQNGNGRWNFPYDMVVKIEYTRVQDPVGVVVCTFDNDCSTFSLQEWEGYGKFRMICWLKLKFQVAIAYLLLTMTIIIYRYFLFLVQLGNPHTHV